MLRHGKHVLRLASFDLTLIGCHMGLTEGYSAATVGHTVHAERAQYMSQVSASTHSYGTP